MAAGSQRPGYGGAEKAARAGNQEVDRGARCFAIDRNLVRAARGVRVRMSRGGSDFSRLHMISSLPNREAIPKSLAAKAP